MTEKNKEEGMGAVSIVLLGMGIFIALWVIWDSLMMYTETVMQQSVQVVMIANGLLVGIFFALLAILFKRK